MSPETQRMEDMAPEATAGASEYVVVRHGFEVAGQRFLIQTGMYSEVTNRISICAIPDSPPAFLGFINHRGETVPVFNLERVSNPKADANGRWVLLIDQGPTAVGIMLDSYPQGLHDLRPLGTPELSAEASTKNQSAFAEFSGAAYAIDQEVWRDFDHRRFATYIKRSFAANMQNEL